MVTTALGTLLAAVSGEMIAIGAGAALVVYYLYELNECMHQNTVPNPVSTWFQELEITESVVG